MKSNLHILLFLYFLFLLSVHHLIFSQKLVVSIWLIFWITIRSIVNSVLNCKIVLFFDNLRVSALAQVVCHPFEFLLYRYSLELLKTNGLRSFKILLSFPFLSLLRRFEIIHQELFIELVSSSFISGFLLYKKLLLLLFLPFWVSEVPDVICVLLI